MPVPTQRRLDLIDNADRDVLALSSVYPDGYVVETHSHQRIQLLHVKTGTMQLETQFGAWIVPPGFAAWIPANVPHQLRTINVTTHSLYFRAGAISQPPSRCQVVEVSPLLKELIDAAMFVPVLYDEHARDGQLMKMLLHETVVQRVVPLHLPMPRDEQLAALCQAFFKAPTLASTPADWARRLHISERTFYRRFVAGTGISFLNWRQQACVLAAMARLSLGDSVTTVALDMGYESPSSFSTMFKKATGRPPNLYMRN